jgi:hypothetical protein
MIDLFVMSKSDDNRFIKQKFHVRWLDQQRSIMYVLLL